MTKSDGDAHLAPSPPAEAEAAGQERAGPDGGRSSDAAAVPAAVDSAGPSGHTGRVDSGGVARAVHAWAGARLATGLARFLDFGARGPMRDEGREDLALSRTGGPVARWVSFPKAVRTTTAATSGVAVGLGAWGLMLAAGGGLVMGAAAMTAGIGLAAASGPIGVRLANRLHRLIALRRRYRISELRGVPDRRAVAVRGVVLASRTAASTLDTRPIVWSLTRFRRGRSPLFSAFFHEVAFDFMLADGTDEPIWVEVAGGMLIDRFPADRRVQFQSTTLLDIDHPFLTQLRIRDKHVRAAEISIAAGDVVEVVGRLSRRLDPTAPSESGREPPHRRALRSGTRVPVMVRRIFEPDLELGRVRRLLPRGAPDASAGEPPVRKF